MLTSHILFLPGHGFGGEKAFDDLLFILKALFFSLFTGGLFILKTIHIFPFVYIHSAIEVLCVYETTLLTGLTTGCLSTAANGRLIFPL